MQWQLAQGCPPPRPNWRLQSRPSWHSRPWVSAGAWSSTLRGHQNPRGSSHLCNRKNCHITYTYLLVHFKSFPRYLHNLIECKGYTSSCDTVLCRENGKENVSVNDWYRHKPHRPNYMLQAGNNIAIFLSIFFDSWLVESTDVESLDMEGQLLFEYKRRLKNPEFVY